MAEGITKGDDPRQLSGWRLLAVYFLWAALLTFPAILHPFELVPGSDRTDIWNSMWSLWVVEDALTSGRLPWHVEGLDWPNGGDLLVNDPLNGLLFTPLIALFGISFGYTALVLFHVTFSGFAAHLLSRRLHSSDFGGLVAGLSFAAAPVLISGVHNGTSEVIGAGWLCLAVLAVVKALDEGGRRTILLAGAALTVVCIAGWYYGVAAWLMFGVFVLLGGTRALLSTRLRRALAIGGFAALLVVPWAAFTVSGMTDTGQVGIKNDRELNTVRRGTGAAAPAGWFIPGDWRSPDFRELSRDGEEFIHCHYLGWALIVLGIIGFRRGGRWRWALAVTGAIGWFLAMGPVATHGGTPIIFGDRLAFPLPYFLLESLPGFSSLSILFRFAVLPSLALSLLAGAAVVGRSPRSAALIAAVVLLELRLASPVAGLPAVATAAPPAPIEALADMPAGAVISFPVVGGRRYLFDQSTHGKPVAAQLNFPINRASRKIWRELERRGSNVQRRLERAASESRQVACPSEGERSPCGAGGELTMVSRGSSDAPICRCTEGVRYLTVYDDPTARPDRYDVGVELVEANFPLVAEGDGVRVFQLW